MRSMQNSNLCDKNNMDFYFQIYQHYFQIYKNFWVMINYSVDFKKKIMFTICHKACKKMTASQ